VSSLAARHASVSLTSPTSNAEKIAETAMRRGQIFVV
jgi:hypothetical protein